MFALNCRVDMLSEHVRRKPVRPQPGPVGGQRPQAELTQPAAEPESEL